MFQDPQMPDTMDSTEPYTHYVSACIYVSMREFNLSIR